MQGCSRTFIYQMVFLVAAVVGLSAQTLTTFVNFDGPHGAAPQSPVIQASDGNFYGTTTGGGGGSRPYGTVFAVTPGGSLTTLHSFSATDGLGPVGGLVEGSDGNFYGTTPQGGTHPAAGTVFVISGGGSFSVLHNFDGTDGAGPYAGLVQGTDGNFYGTTISGGPNGYGTVFKITPAGVLTTLYGFSSGDGASPFGALILGTDGNFYGTTYGGGHNANCDGLDACGTVFKITPAGVLTTLYNFCSQTNCTDGARPYAGLVQAGDGNFYGTTWQGGANCVPGLNGGCGTVFKITPTGTFTSLYSFCTQTDCTDGKNPFYGSLVQASDGNLYGTTWLGGIHTICSNGCGTIFRITLGGSFTTLHSFNHTTDGDLPFAGMIQATDGNLYGTASSGGAHDDGTIYAFNPGIPPTPVQFVPLTPCRVVDTRNPSGPLGGPAIIGGTARSFPLPTGDCSIPDTAKVYSLNVTVVPHGRLGYLTIWPTGQGQPQVSTMNSDGRTKANAAIVPAGTGGAVSVYVSDTTDVLLDINGYFTSTTPAVTYEFYPLPPCRLVDTRNPNGHLGGPYLQGAVERDFPLLESPCLNGLPQVQAYSLNFTVLPNPSGQHLGYLTVWPAGGEQPAVSTLNNLTATNVANAAIVPAPPDGRIAVYPSQSTDLLVDINGYFAAPGALGLQLYPTTPCRVLDTRSGGGQPFSGELTVNVAGSPCAPSVNAQAYVLNATVIPSGRLGYLTLWPNGQAQPNVSTLNAIDGAVTSNMAIVPTSDGSIDAYASQLTQLILDISGYFAP
jgi:uncharacterized repeat protein (TIGR03803 family)